MENNESTATASSTFNWFKQNATKPLVLSSKGMVIPLNFMVAISKANKPDSPFEEVSKIESTIFLITGPSTGCKTSMVSNSIASIPKVVDQIMSLTSMLPERTTAVS